MLRSRHFVFWDDNLFANKTYALELMRAIAPLRKKWAAQATLADCSDETLLKAAQEAGCLYLFIGLEAFSQESLSDAGKPINRIADYRAVIQRIHAHKMMVQAGVVFGFDHDTADVFAHTLQSCEALGIDGVTVSILTPLPHTPVYEQFRQEGRLLTGDWSDYDGKTAVAYTPKNMTPGQLYGGYLKFRRQFYSLPSFIRRMRVSRTHIVYNALINLGYRLAIR